MTTPGFPGTPGFPRTPGFPASHSKPGLQPYQALIYKRALHPELFQGRATRTIRHGAYELECVLMNGAHLLRFSHKSACMSELLTSQDAALPEIGLVGSFVCESEHEFEHILAGTGVTYMTSVQIENLSDNIFADTYEEMLDFGRQSKALIVRWEDDAGSCASILDLQHQRQEIHAQSYHFIAQGGLVVRSQTIFEHA